MKDTGQGSDVSAGRSRRRSWNHLTEEVARLAGRGVAMRLRLGGHITPRHDLSLRFGPLEPNGALPGHLVARTRQGTLAARRVVLWDPRSMGFELRDERAIERLFQRLDPVGALVAWARRALAGPARAVGFLGALPDLPLFLVVCLVAAALNGLLYTWLGTADARLLLSCGILPDLAGAVACAHAYERRLHRLREAVLQAACHAIAPETFSAPR